MQRKIRLNVVEDNPYASVNCFLEITPRPRKPGGHVVPWPGGVVTFYVDTLAGHTTLGTATAKLLDIPLELFEIVETETVFGPTRVRRIRDVRLTLPGEDNGAPVPIDLPDIHVTDPSIMDPPPRENLEHVPDILGTDVLRRGAIYLNWDHAEGWLLPRNTQLGSMHISDPTL